MINVAMEKRTEQLNKILSEKKAGFQIACHDFWKNNRMQTAYVLTGNTANCCPAFYYDPVWFEQEDSAVAEFLIAKANSASCSVDIINLLDADYIKTHIMPRVTSGNNLKDLQASGIACRSYLDLAVLYYIPVNDKLFPLSKDGLASVQVTSRLLSEIDMSEDEAYERAMYNFAQSVDLIEMDTMLRNFFIEAEKIYGPKPSGSNMWVLTNKTMTYGAAVLLFGEDLFRTLEEKVQQKIVILPSSVHEVIAVSYENERELAQFLEMVNEINSSDVISESDFLSNNIYYYDHVTEKACVLM